MSMKEKAVDPHQAAAMSLGFMVRTIWRHRQLISQMTSREVSSRYKGSVLGMAWSVVNPLIMLAVYTFVFSVVFKPRWDVGNVGHVSASTEVAAILFVGIFIHALFGEIINRAPDLIVANQNYVKRVVFPLEILPIVAVCSALVNTCVSAFLVLGMLLLFNGEVHFSSVFLPMVISPLILVALGIAWIFSSLGVYLRDIRQLPAAITAILLFLSPVFYPLTAVPEAFRRVMVLNPLTFVIEQARSVIIYGNMPDWSGLAMYTASAVGVAWIGFAWFQYGRKGFADVL